MRSQLRDEFAKAALTGLLAQDDTWVVDQDSLNALAVTAYNCADAMMQEGEFKTCPECGAGLERIPAAESLSGRDEMAMRHKTGCSSGWPTDLPLDVLGS